MLPCRRHFGKGVKMVKPVAFLLVTAMLAPLLLQAKEARLSEQNLAGPADPNDQIAISGVGFCGCDLFRDGIIDTFDLAVFAANWRDEDCGLGNNSCNGADINGSGFVDYRDLYTLAVTCWLDEDKEPPTPNPMDWDRSVDANGFDGTPRQILLPPYTVFDYGATMRADPNTADDTGFEFYFECFENSGFDSGWVFFSDGPPYEYTVKLGSPTLKYHFRVRARDLSIRANTTDSSDWDKAD